MVLLNQIVKPLYCVQLIGFDGSFKSDSQTSILCGEFLGKLWKGMTFGNFGKVL